MTTLYKLTEGNSTSMGGTKWSEGVSYTAPGGVLCSSDVLHAYRSPLLAVFMAPLHVDFVSPKLWVCEGEVCIDDGTKVGCTYLCTLEEIVLPVVTTVQRVAFGILSAKQVCKDSDWHAWADNWLSGEDRTCAAANAAANAAYAAAHAAHAAANAAYAAANAARAAHATHASRAAYAANAAAHTAHAASYAAFHEPDLVSIADQAVKYA